MPKLNFKQHILPHLVAIGTFLIIMVIFFSPMFLENKTLQMGDVLQGWGAGQEIKEFRENTGEEALWTNSMFAGMPAYLINIKYQGEEIINTFHKILSLGLPRQVEVIFKGMVCFYILLLVFKVRPYLAIAGGIAFGMGTFNLISMEAGHIWKVEAIAYMPLVLAGIHLAFRGKRLWGFTLTALALALEIDSNHLQITYYLFLLVLIYGAAMLIQAIREKTLASFGISMAILSLAALLAVGTTLGRLWNTYQYGQYSIRGPSELTSTSEATQGSGLDRDYAFAYSITPLETFTLLVPDLFGGNTGRALGDDSAIADFLRSRNVPRQQIDQMTSRVATYWGGKPFTGGPTYAGTVVVLLFIIGCFFAPQPHRVWLIVATTFSVILAWGDNFPALNYLIFDFLPGYNKFRTVEMALVIALLCIPLLGFIGLEALLSRAWNKETKQKFFWAGGIGAGLLLTLVIFSGTFDYASPVDAQYLSAGEQEFVDALHDDRAALLRSDVFRSLLFLGLGLGLLYAYRIGKLNFPILAAGLTLLVLIDLWSVDRRYLSEDNYVRKSNQLGYLEATEADQRILQDPDLYYRVLNLQNPFQDARTSYHHASLGGYHAARLRRYQDLIDRYLLGELQGIIQQLQQGQLNMSQFPVVNMLNAKYLIAGNTANAVITNTQALGNAWLVKQVQPVQNPDEAIAALGTIDPAQTAIVNTSEFEVSANNFSNDGSIQLTEYRPNYLKYEANVSGESLAVFSEVYYADGWEATIDGQPADYFRADYILRALPIPAGQHTVEFTFNPASYRVGSTVMLVASVILLLVFLATLVLSIRQWMQKETA
ncbi:MAG: YfhO family protein [Cyclobacteriaceae bacterium]